LESKTNYFIVGLIVILLTAALIIGGLWLSTGFDQKKYNTYTVYMHEAVSGLNIESPVKYNGVKVGLVSDIELNDVNPQQVTLQLQIAEGTPITTSTQATLISQGITGTTYLGLSATSSTKTPLQKEPGEPYPVIPYKRSFFSQLENNVNELSVNIKQIFDKENSEHIKQTLTSLQKIAAVIEKNSDNLNTSLHDLPELIQNLKYSVVQFNKMSREVAAAGTQLSDTMRAGRNSIDKISQHAIPPAVLLLRRLDLIAANIEKMSADMRQNPAVIIRGSAPPKLGPGE
jgi:phospholipid/cholesterol/gamma-HCH transport system substrate-binding protein